MKKALTATFSTLAILIFVASIILMVTGTIALRRNEPVYILGKALAVVPTDSMVGDREDSLDINDMVIVEKADISKVEIDDVIVFQGVSGSGAPILIIHRVVGFEEEGILTQGDKEGAPIDQPRYQDYVTEENFQGIYESKITFLKPIAQAMTSSKALIFAVLAIVLTVMLISEVVHLVKTYQEDKNAKLEEEHEKELELLRKAKKKEILEEIKKEEQFK